MLKDPKTCAILAANTLDDKKGQDVTVLDISKGAIFADYFVIATGISPIHVKALADEVEKKLLAEDYTLRNKEGYHEGKWILLDFYDVIIHVFTSAGREYYRLERLWDATKLETLAKE